MKPKSLIKICLSIALLAWVAFSVDFSKLSGTLRAIPLTFVALVIGCYGLGQLLSSYKWWTLAKAAGIVVPYRTALKAYFIGMFVNCFGLGMVGGDVARGVMIAHGVPKKSEGIGTVVADRIHGLAVLSGIALVAAVFLGSERVPRELILLLALLLVGFIAIWAIGPAFLARMPIIKDTSLAPKFRQLATVFPHDLGVLCKVTVVSVIFHSVQIALHGVMAVGVGAPIPMMTLFAVIPFVNIFSSLPISWNGLGVREKSYIFFLVTQQPSLVTNEQAVAFGALWLLAMTTTSAIGGVVAVFSGELQVLKNRRVQEAS
jgi:uncharacterized membrane protein YbhN (UPF0104 family)